MLTYREPHEVRDKAKLAALVEAFRAGQAVPAIVVNGETAITGSHRIAAHRAAWKAWDRGEDGWEDRDEPTLDTVVVTDDELRAACDFAGVDDIADFTHLDDLCDAIWHTTDDEELREALADQRGV